MTYIPDLSPLRYLPQTQSKPNVLSVGWLGRCERSGWISRLKGNRPPRDSASLVATLKGLAALNQTPCPTFGYHTCETCLSENSRGEFWFTSASGITYVMPNMVFHYIEAHGYVLPREVFDALRELQPRLAAAAEERELAEERKFSESHCDTCGASFFGEAESYCPACGGIICKCGHCFCDVS